MHYRLWLGGLVLSVLFNSGIAINPASAATIVEPGQQNRYIKEIDDFGLKDSQITTHVFSNDVWNSGLIDLDDIFTLKTGATFELDIKFDKGLQLIDGTFISKNESFHIDVQGTGGVGGAPNNKADFELRIPGARKFGDPLAFNPTHSGQVTQNALSGNVNFDESFEIVKTGKTGFTGLDLKLTNLNKNDWSFGKIGVGFDAKNVTIVDKPQASIIDLKIEQEILRRQLVATIKLAYCQSASPTQARCRA